MSSLRARLRRSAVAALSASMLVAPRAAIANEPDQKALHTEKLGPVIKTWKVPPDPRYEPRPDPKSRLTPRQAQFIATQLRTQVGRCLTFDARTQRKIDIEFRLQPSGALAAQPKVVTTGSGSDHEAASASGIRAIVKCAPYRLPADLYQGGWDHVVLTIDLTPMR